MENKHPQLLTRRKFTTSPLHYFTTLSSEFFHCLYLGVNFFKK
jgi:hypothetical protein